MAEDLLTHEERTGLQRILERLYDFTDGGPRGRRIFLQDTARLGRFVPGMVFSDSSRTFVASLVAKLERFGFLPERPSYHALGALIDAVLGLGELETDKAFYLAGLVVRYSLVADADYLAKLRDKHGIDAPAVLDPEPEAAAPARELAEDPDAPDFEPHIDDTEGLESILGSEDNFIDLYMLTAAVYCAKVVGRVELPEGRAIGTGFLVGPDLLLTCQHVLKDKTYLEDAVIHFGYENDASGVAGKGRVVAMRKDFYHASPAHKLDYALVRLEEAPLQGTAARGEEAKSGIPELTRLGKHRGFLTLAPRLLTSLSRVNILQHPYGEPLKVVMTQNYVVNRKPTRIQYLADTYRGSSGSPIFNHRWEVVALHHSGKPYPPEPAGAKKNPKAKFGVNEGIPMRAILEDFEKKRLIRHLPRD